MGCSLQSEDLQDINTSLILKHSNKLRLAFVIKICTFVGFKI